MTRRRGLVVGALLAGLVLTGCTDVAAEPISSPGMTRSSSTPSADPSSTPSASPTGTPSAEPTNTPNSTPTSTPTTSPTRTPTATPTGSPTTEPTSKPTSKPTPDVNYALEVEKKLDAWGYPVGDVDGDITPRARQALCAWRETNGLPVNRGRLTTADVRSVLLATKRPAPAKPDGIYVNKTCQVLYQVVNKTYRRIVWVSTGAAGYETPNRTGKVWRKWAGAHESSLYDDAYMYDSIYFLEDRPGIALHGSRVNSLVKTYPASHSCVRVMRPQIHRIFEETPIGTTVSVYGQY